MTGENELMQAAKTWEQVIISFCVLSIVGSMVWLVHRWMQQAERREARMAQRIDDLERYMREVLVKAVAENTAAFQQLMNKLDTRPCLLTDLKQHELVNVIAEQVSDKIKP